MSERFNLSSGPHFRDRLYIHTIMGLVCLALLPAAALGVYFNGLKALLVILVSVVFSAGTEFIFDKLTGRPNTVTDLSAVVTGLLLALSLSADVPLYVPAIGAIFAILVAKCCFGGLGRNFINPALAGRCFLLISFGTSMTRYTIDGVSSATPLAVLRAGKTVDVTRMFIGSAGGVIGASAAALLAGGLLLWALDIIHTPISFSVIGSFSVMMLLFGGQGFDLGFLAAHLSGGGLLMGALFMATDYTTSPFSREGQVIYGCLIGVLGALFRIAGSSADSFSYAIVIANLFTPLIDSFIIPKPYAYQARAIELRETQKKKNIFQRIPGAAKVLTLITLIAGIALSGVYMMTKDAIEEQKRAANVASYKEVLPAAETFVSDSAVDDALRQIAGQVYAPRFGRSYINEAMIGKDSDGNTAGYVISVRSADGYDGDIVLTVGILPDGTVSGIAFTELTETPGMGMRAGDPEFKDQFSGRKVSSFVLNKGGTPSDNTIDTVSGASTTSGAVVNAVNAAIAFFENNMKGGL